MIIINNNTVIMYHYDCVNMNNKEAKYYFSILNEGVEVSELLIYIHIHTYLSILNISNNNK